MLQSKIYFPKAMDSTLLLLQFQFQFQATSNPPSLHIEHLFNKR